MNKLYKLLKVIFSALLEDSLEKKQIRDKANFSHTLSYKSSFIPKTVSQRNIQENKYVFDNKNLTFSSLISMTFQVAWNKQKLSQATLYIIIITLIVNYYFVD